MKNLIRELYHFLTLRLLFPWQYRRYAAQPMQREKVVFIEANLPQLSNSLLTMYEELSRDGRFQVKVHCLQEIYIGKRTYVKNALDCLRDMANARAVFLCEGSRLVSCIHPRPETVIVQLWHGCGAFKRFGFSTSDLRFGGNRRENETYSYYKNFDLVTVSSPEVVWAYEEAMNLQKHSGIVLPLGISRTDVFFREKFLRRAEAHVFEVLPQCRGKKILLYAPTFRGSVGGAKAPEELDILLLREMLGGEYYLLIKHHPIVKDRPPLPPGTEDFAADATDLLPTEELMCVSDVCISDYSSLIFEYSLFERPMIFFAYDLEEYGDWRGFYYSYEEMTPGPVVRTTEEIAACLRNPEEQFDMQKVREFREKYMCACDGRATERILRHIELIAG